MKCACAVLSSVVCRVVPYYSALSHKQQDFRGKNVIEHKLCVLIFSANCLKYFSFIRRNERAVIKNVCWSWCKVPVILVRL